MPHDKMRPFTYLQVDHICYQIGEWYLEWKIKISPYPNNLGFAKEQLKEMICGDVNPHDLIDERFEDDVVNEDKTVKEDPISLTIDERKELKHFERIVKNVLEGPNSKFLKNHYILDNMGDPIPCDDFDKWVEFFERNFDESKARVSRTIFGDGSYISTIFVGIYMGFDTEKPLLFETMTFDKDGEILYTERYPNRHLALAGHCKAIASYVIDKMGRELNV